MLTIDQLLNCPTPTKGREEAVRWLEILEALGRAPNTVAAYGRGVGAYLAFCRFRDIDPLHAGLDEVSLFVRHMRAFPNPKGDTVRDIRSGCGLSSATLLQRLCAVRLWYDFLKFENLVDRNPVPRGRWNRGGVVGPKRGLVPGQVQLPKIPTDAEWRLLCEAAREESPRNRLMFALAYYCALRRQELVSLHIGDLDVSSHLISVRAETTKTKRGRVVPYRAEVDPLIGAYFREWRALAAHGAEELFVSLSPRNRGLPITVSSWNKVVEGIRKRAGVRAFSTHTFRHLRLTHLARGGMKLHEIAEFAGHTSVSSTLIYLHLSGRDLSRSVAAATSRLVPQHPFQP